MSDDGATRAAAWLSAWDSQGIHRTATAGDEAGAAWLMREAAGLGAAPAAEDFALDRLDRDQPRWASPSCALLPDAQQKHATAEARDRLALTRGSLPVGLGTHHQRGQRLNPTGAPTSSTDRSAATILGHERPRPRGTCQRPARPHRCIRWWWRSTLGDVILASKPGIVATHISSSSASERSCAAIAL